MKKFILCLLLAYSFCLDEPVYTKEDNVIVLKDDTFDDFIQTHDYVLVKIYAPWCTHCKRLAPEFSKAAPILEQEGLYLAQVDGTVEKKIASRFKVVGYPVVKFFVKGEAKDYRAGRTASDIITYVRKHSTGPLKELKTLEEVEIYKKLRNISMIYFGDNENTLNEYKKVSMGVSEKDELQFAYCSLKEAQEKFSVKDNSIVIYNKIDNLTYELTTDFTQENISKFVDKYITPLIMEYSLQVHMFMLDKKTPCLVLFRDKKQDCSKILELMKKLSPSYLDRVKFVDVDVTEGYANRFADYIGVNPEDYPTIFLLAKKTKDFMRYKLEKEINEDNLKEFIEKFLKHELEPYIKSEKVPLTQEGDVYKLVAKTYSKIVLESDNDVLVKFILPESEDCKKLEPIYSDLAKKLKNNKKLIIAEIDISKNEVEGIAFKSFPTIKFWPGNKKNEQPVSFDGDRTVDGFISFLQKHASNGINLEEDSKDNKETQDDKEVKKQDL